METKNNINLETKINQKRISLFSFLTKEIEISPKKLRTRCWLFCMIGYPVIYLVSNGSFEKFGDPVNIIFFISLTFIISWSITFLHRQVRKKSKSTMAVALSSIVGFFLGLFLTGLVLITLFYGLMILIYS